MQRPPILFFVLAVFAGSVVLASCSEENTKKTEANKAMTVGVITLKSQAVTLTKELPGRTVASQIAEIRPQVNGIVKSRLFTEGSEVEAGQPLYQIDPALFEANVASAEAAVAGAQASIASNKAKTARYSEMLKINAISRQDFDEADATYKEAKADLLIAQAQLKSAQINLNYSEVSAPIKGQISKSAVTVGALVSANQTAALATVTQLDPIYVDLVQSSAELLQLKRALSSGALSVDPDAQAEVELILEDGSSYSHKGTLHFTEVTVDPSTGSVTLRAQFANPENLLLPGMYVRAVLVEGLKSNAILAPQRGISRNIKGEATAMIVNKDSKVEVRVLNVVRTIGANWLVEKGLSAGDQLIVEGLQKIQPGAPVQTVPAQSVITNGQ